jgi:hypothetical protein
VLVEKRAELFHLPTAEIADVERRSVRVPVKMTVLEGVIPVIGILIQHEGKPDAFKMGLVLGDPFLPRLVPRSGSACLR